jgi:apolipoprotein N-acyltransferase
MMQIPMADQTPGARIQGSFQVKDQWVLPNICYEDLFGEEIADQLAAAYFANKIPATVLLNVSNLAWFDDSSALQQHLQISQMRALETGRPIIRATNTGTTALIAPDGAVMASLPVLVRDSLDLTVQGYAGITPYIRWGNTAIVLMAVLSLLIAASLNALSRNKR